MGERVAITTMLDAGTSVSKIAVSLDRSRAAIQTVIDEAKDLLKSSAKFYAEAHLRATEIASKDGNSRPAEWALERLKIVDPVKVEPNQGFTVNIGVLLPGLGNHAAVVSDRGRDGQVIEGEALSGD